MLAAVVHDLLLGSLLARFIRVTGTNLVTTARGRYNIEAGTMVVERRPNFRGASNARIPVNRL